MVHKTLNRHPRESGDLEKLQTTTNLKQNLIRKYYSKHLSAINPDI